MPSIFANFVQPRLPQVFLAPTLAVVAPLPVPLVRCHTPELDRGIAG
jgi:hypothetical protein